VRSPRDIFVIGFLFGLGFDTATTIGLLLLTVTASLAGVPAAALIGLLAHGSDVCRAYQGQERARTCATTAAMIRNALRG